MIAKGRQDVLEEKLRAAKLENQEQRRIIEETKCNIEVELKKKDEEVESWTWMTERCAELDKLLKQKKSVKNRLLKEKLEAEEKAEEYKKVLKQTAGNVFNGGALAFGAAKIVASAVGTAAYAAGSAAVNTAGAVRDYVAAHTPEAKAAEAKRREMERRMNLCKKIDFKSPKRS
ncbi:hypothetical protein LINGRAHAP2_LOCUS8543 [Linum grandiflorum]